MYTDKTRYTSKYEITFELVKDLCPTKKWLPVSRKDSKGSGPSGSNSQSGPKKSHTPKGGAQSTSDKLVSGKTSNDTGNTGAGNADGSPAVRKTGHEAGNAPGTLLKEKRGRNYPPPPVKETHFYEGPEKTLVLVHDEESDTDKKDLSWFFPGHEEPSKPTSLMVISSDNDIPPLPFDMAPSDYQDLGIPILTGPKPKTDEDQQTPTKTLAGTNTPGIPQAPTSTGRQEKGSPAASLPKTFTLAIDFLELDKLANQSF